MVSEFAFMMRVATIEDQGGLHMMETFWDCLLMVVVIIMQDKEDMDNSSQNKDQSMLEVMWILALVGALGISPSIILGSLAMLQLIWSGSSSFMEVMLERWIQEVSTS
jgi:hypothetical protein